MKTKRFCTSCLALVAGLFIVNQTIAGQLSLTEWAQQATASDPEKAAQAIQQLRQAGPAGLDALFQVYSNQVTAHLTPPLPLAAVCTPDVAWEKVRAAFDTVGQQRDCYASHLFWHTNLDEAEAVARASGKPILSLRLLGKLNEEYSCANSRFFRTTLYANATVSQFLRDHFVLHWQSERPVPHITIDMGDGRKIERTITGNSIHYVLDSEGRPIDALPGLYGAQTFVADLTQAETAARQSASMNASDREAFLKTYHATQLADIQHRWATDLERVGKATTNTDLNQLDALTDDQTWEKIAMFHYDDSRLDPAAYHLASDKFGPMPLPTAQQAARMTVSKSFVENPMIRAMKNLERSISTDTAHNEYQLHSRIYQWWIEGSAPQNLSDLNKKIYAQIFLTPESDPWLGLAPADTFSALDHNGLVTGN